MLGRAVTHGTSAKTLSAFGEMKGSPWRTPRLINGLQQVLRGKMMATIPVESHVISSPARYRFGRKKKIAPVSASWQHFGVSSNGRFSRCAVNIRAASGKK